jgi:hypothetical protein
MSIQQPTEDLLDLIYQAAAEPELWGSVMSQIASVLESDGGILYGQSTTIGGARKIHFEHNGGLDETCNAAFKEKHRLNPWSAHMVRQPTGRIVLSEEIIPLRQLQRTDFYAEVLRPQNVAHNMMVGLAAQRDFLVAFNICRGPRKGPFDEPARRFLGGLVPHLQRSLLLGRRLDARAGSTISDGRIGGSSA